MHKKLCRLGKTLLSFLLCCVTLSCGKGYVENDASQEELAAGHHWARLQPLNQKMGIFNGWLSMSVSDNQFWVRVKVNGPKTNVMHAQYLHFNDKCPTMKDDQNRDGYLDFMEAYQIAGPILIPLDSNLNSQLKGLNEFPKMKGNSSFYYYSEACNMSYMMQDLRLRDEYSADMMTKIPGRKKINFNKRVVIIYGINDERSLPGSVRSFEGYPGQASLPIACGEIQDGYTDAFNFY